MTPDGPKNAKNLKILTFAWFFYLLSPKMGKQKTPDLIFHPYALTEPAIKSYLDWQWPEKREKHKNFDFCLIFLSIITKNGETKTPDLIFCLYALTEPVTKSFLDWQWVPTMWLLTLWLWEANLTGPSYYGHPLLVKIGFCWYFSLCIWMTEVISGILCFPNFHFCSPGTVKMYGQKVHNKIA